MNEIESLQHTLQTRFPDCSFKLSPPLNPDGYWTLDIRQKTRWFVVDWAPPNRFGVSENTESTAYGEGPDAIYSDSSKALERIETLLAADKPAVPPVTNVRREWIIIMSVKGPRHFMARDVLQKIHGKGVAERIAVYSTKVSREVGRVTALELRDDDLHAELELEATTPKAPRAAGFVALERSPRLIGVLYSDWPLEAIAHLSERIRAGGDFGGLKGRRG